MRALYIFLIDGTLLTIVAFILLTQVIFPAWTGLPYFWFFKKKGRRAVDERFGYLIGRRTKGPAASTTNNQISNNGKN